MNYLIIDFALINVVYCALRFAAELVDVRNFTLRC